MNYKIKNYKEFIKKYPWLDVGKLVYIKPLGINKVVNNYPKCKENPSL
jgi:hypothetical protein